VNAHLESAAVKHLSLVLHAKEQLADRVRSLEEERGVVHAKLVVRFQSCCFSVDFVLIGIVALSGHRQQARVARVGSTTR
jgi:hypothetical protein